MFLFQSMFAFHRKYISFLETQRHLAVESKNNNPKYQTYIRNKIPTLMEIECKQTNKF